MSVGLDKHLEVVDPQGPQPLPDTTACANGLLHCQLLLISLIIAPLLAPDSSVFLGLFYTLGKYMYVEDNSSDNL